MNTAALPPTWRQRHPYAAELLVIAGIGVAVGLLLFFVRGRQFWIGMTYAMLISLCIGITIGLLQRGVCRLLLSRDPDNERLRQHWPGWAWMLPCVLLGALIGHEIGTLLAAQLLGHEFRGMGTGGWRQLVFGGGFTLLVSMAATAFFYGRERLHQAQLENAAVQRQAAEAQLLALQTQIEPHMLFNTLAHLRVLIKLRPDDAQAMLDELIAYLRATLQASRVPLHPLATEFERLGEYLKLMQRRMGPRLALQLDLPAELGTLPVPPLLLQPLVENAIKHGLEPSVEGGLLQVRAWREGAQLHLLVQDDGVGLGAQAASGGTHFGTEQVRERLRTQYGAAAQFRLEAAIPRGCRALISLPL